ncbi:TonB-dependent receptor [Sphingomonas sp. CROZ-RG-20F-R02-07]|uniref:TonB-dependent receptor n=1 Tax=Sphingomonas sp. CROZ-RG-20F-R02-07 TaxID=2914832 RepID=UPI001F570650|nr:TonB-dependent receptor [Sphingomonas sp. CROZ-RG-20F-R02-07]
MTVAPAALSSLPAQALAAPMQTDQTDSGNQNVPDAKDAKSGSDIVVTGVRQSLASAATLKRDSDSILDAVVAQDIGKLPDDNAAETLARIAGVQVQRYNDEVSGILVRGLPDVATSLNGREFFTAEQRQAALQDFPSQALAALEIYKSGTADLIEPGLAGLINVRTRRPFDFKGLEMAGGIRGTYNDQSRKFDPGGNILVSDRWSTGIGEIGFLANVTYAQSQYHNGIRFNNTYITDASPASIITPASVGNNIRYPYTVGLYNTSGKRDRPSGNFSMQWQPSNDLQFYLEGIYQGYREQSIVDDFEADLRGESATGAAPTLSDVVLVDGTRQVKSLTKSGGYRPQMYRSTSLSSTDTYQVAIGGKWTTGIATLTTDAAYSHSVYHTRAHSIDSALTTAPTIQADFIKDGGVAFSLPNYDITNPNNYIWRGYYETKYRTAGNGFQWRSDLVLDTSTWPLLHKLQFGYRITDRSASYLSGNRYAYTEDLQIPFASLPIGKLVLSQNPFRDPVQGFTQYLVPSYTGVYNNQAALLPASRQALAQLVALNPTDQGYKDAQTAFATDDVQIDPANTYHASEQTYAAYLQGKYGVNIGSIVIDGVAGLRAVITHGLYSGTSQITNNGVTVETPQRLRQDYLDLLPNASMRVKFTDKLQLRLGYTFTRTKPDFGELDPAVQINQVIRNPNKPIDPSDPTSRITATGSGGNPNLRPLTSHNYDASLEYYFSKSGFVSAALFYRNLNGFINNYTRYVDDPQYGFLQLSRPENAGEGKIKGAEVNFQTFFDFLPGALKGFGIQTNATYLDGKNRTPQFAIGTGAFTYGDFVQIVGLSKWAYNAAVFYEKHGITTRLSYNYRNPYIRSFGTDILGNQTTWHTKSISRLDFSFSYDVTKQFTLSVDASNLLAKPFNNYTQDYYGYDYAQDVRDEGRYIGFGLRFRFGK